MSNRGPLPEVLRPVTIPLSRLYRLAIDRRNARFDRGEGVRRVDRPVISVGNITTGGVGKTPFVRWLVRRLVEEGHRPMIAMRGYGGTVARPSDEAMEHQATLPEVPLAVNPDRAAGVEAALGRPEGRKVDCIVLDDGFQHRRMARDVDLVLIDARANTFAQRMLPAGHLREPLENLRRAAGVVITHAEAVNRQLAMQVERHHGRPPLAWTRHAWTGLELHHPDGRAERVGVDWLKGKRLAAMLAVGNPDAVIRHAEEAGARIESRRVRRDHHRFDGSDAEWVTEIVIGDGADGSLVTMKDWVKLGPIIREIDQEEPDLTAQNLEWRKPIVVPRLDIAFIEGEQAVMDLVRQAIANPASATG
jgi:tetraacyldisaccharide 4'-kinase